MESTSMPDVESTPQPNVLPIVLSALVSPRDDARSFRRYPLMLEAGIGRGAESAPHTLTLCPHGTYNQVGRLTFHSVLVQNLSVTGMYFISALPYRVGVSLEVQLSPPGLVVTLPAVVRRLDAPARTEMGMLETAFGCGVDFLHLETATVARRALMEFLVRRSSPNKTNVLDHNVLSQLSASRRYLPAR